MTTLMRIFTPLVWFLVFLSILTLVAFFKFGAYIGKKYGLRTANEEIALYPLRWNENILLIDILFPTEGFLMLYNQQLQDFLDLALLWTWAHWCGVLVEDYSSTSSPATSWLSWSNPAGTNPFGPFQTCLRETWDWYCGHSMVTTSEKRWETHM